MSKARKLIATAEIENATASIYIGSQPNNNIRHTVSNMVNGRVIAANLNTSRNGSPPLTSNVHIREVASRFIDFSKQD